METIPLIRDYSGITSTQFDKDAHKFVDDLPQQTKERYFKQINVFTAAQHRAILANFYEDYEPPSFLRGLNTTIAEMQSASDLANNTFNEIYERVTHSFITIMRESFKSKSIPSLAPSDLKPILKIVVSDEGPRFTQFFDYVIFNCLDNLATNPKASKLLMNAIESVITAKMAKKRNKPNGFA